MPDDLKQPRVLLTETEAAEAIGLTARFLQVRRHRGGGPPYVRVSSRCIRYRPEDLEAWAAERVRTSTSDRGGSEHSGENSGGSGGGGDTEGLEKIDQ